MILPKGSILKFAELATPDTKTGLTEENRSEVDVTYERLGSKNRMTNGRMRGWYIADKRTFNVSWSMVPHDTAFTIDKMMGGQQMKNWYDSHPGEFYLWYRTPDGTEAQVMVLFDSFSFKVQKRGRYEFWNVTMTLVEV